MEASFDPAAGNHGELLNTLVFAVRTIGIRIEIADISAFNQRSCGCHWIEPFRNRDREFAQLARLGKPDRCTGCLAHFRGSELAQAYQQDPLRLEPGWGMQQDCLTAPGGEFAAVQDRRRRLG